MIDGKKALALSMQYTDEHGGGGGGTTNYNSLSNRPQINGTTLSGNKTGTQLGLQQTLTFDNAPTQNSNNPVKSGGIYTALAEKVTSEAGKGLSSNDFTNELKTKLEGIAAGAEVNAISSIVLNGVTLVPTNKQVAINVITRTVNNLTNYYLKTETYNKTEVDDIVTAIKNSRFEVVATLPTTDIKTNVIYLVPKSPSQTSNVKDEYINLDGTSAGWEKIGDTEIDLSDYVTTQALNTALASYTTTADLTTLLAAKQDTLTFDNVPTENSNNPVKSGGVYNSEQDIYKINGFLGAKNLVQYPYFYGISGHIETLYNVDFTINNDLSITIDGTSTNSGEIYYAIKKNIYINDLKSKNLILSSGGVSGTDVWLGVYEYDQEGTPTVTHMYTTKDADTVAFTLDDTTIKINVFIRVKALATIDNVTIYPMLRYAEDIDSTYQPYAKTNKQLTEDSIDWDNFSELGAVNMLPNTATTQTINGVTFTVNSDGTVTANGTATANAVLKISDRFTLADYIGRKYVDAKKNEASSSTYSLIITYRDGSGAYVNETYVPTEGFILSTISNATLVEFGVFVKSGQSVSNLTFKPMITVASYNGDYVPYAKTNRELTEDVADARVLIGSVNQHVSVIADGTKTIQTLMQELHSALSSLVASLNTDETIYILGARSDGGTWFRPSNVELKYSKSSTVGNISMDSFTVTAGENCYHYSLTFSSTLATNTFRQMTVAQSGNTFVNRTSDVPSANSQLLLTYQIYKTIS